MSEKIDVDRFLKKLDGCFNKNDLVSADECIDFWESEARNACDERALLTILNERLGLSRRMNDSKKGTDAILECISLVEKLNLTNNISGATIYINAATTSSHFGKDQEGIVLYDKAKKCYVDNGQTNSYEYATLLNNSAGVLCKLKKYDLAEKNYLDAIEILKKLGNRDGEIALSLVMLAYIAYDSSDNPDDTVYEKVENLLDESIKYLKSDKIVRDGNFAFILDKCAPSFDYFKRPGQAKAMRELAKEIYNK